MHNLTPPSLATPKSNVAAVLVHTGAQLRVSPKEAKETKVVLARSFPPSLPESRSCRAPGVQNEARGAPARGGHQVHARNTALTPRTPNKTRHPRAAQDRFAQPGVRQLLGPRPLAATGSAAEPGRRPLSRLSWPWRTLKGKRPSTQRPMLAPQESTGSWRKARGEWAPRSGPKLTRRCERRCRRWRTRRCRRRRDRAGPAGAGRSAARAPRSTLPCSCSSQIRAGVTALRRRCSLAQPPDRCSPARCPAACSPGCPPPLAFLMSTDSEKELGVRG